MQTRHKEDRRPPHTAGTNTNFLVGAWGEGGREGRSINRGKQLMLLDKGGSQEASFPAFHGRDSYATMAPALCGHVHFRSTRRLLVTGWVNRN